MLKFFDVQHPMFRPLWLRIVIVGLSAVWALFELSNGNGMWAIVFGAAGVYLGWQFFVVFDPEKSEGDER